MGVRSFSALAPVGNQAANAQPYPMIPGLPAAAIGDTVAAFVWYAQANWSSSASLIAPDGFTQRGEYGLSGSRTLVAYTRKLLTEADVASVKGGIPVGAGFAATRIVAHAVALESCDWLDVGAPKYAGSGGTAFSYAQPAVGGDFRLSAVSTNNSSPSSEADATPNPATGTLVSKARAVSAASGNVSDSKQFVTMNASSVTFSVAATNAQGISLSFTNVAPAVDTTAPTAPTALTVTRNADDTVSLAWGASTDAVGVSGYRVHRGATAAFTPAAENQVAATTGTTAVDRPPASGVWHYRVVAVDAAGNVSTPSSSANVEIYQTDLVVAVGGTARAARLLGVVVGGVLRPVNVMPSRRSHRISDLVSQPSFAIAHRGFGDQRPEHTMAAYDFAVQQGMQAIEVSAHRTSDGVFVCHHDLTTLRETGQDYTIASTPYATIAGLTVTAAATDNPSQPRQPIPRLVDVLDKYAATHVIFLEAKNGADTTALLDLMDTYPDSREHLVWKQYAGSNSNRAGARTRGYKLWGYVASAADVASLKNTWGPFFDYLGVYHGLTDAQIREVVAYGLTNGQKTIVWETHTPEDRVRFLNLGAAGLMTSSVHAVAF